MHTLSVSSFRQKPESSGFLRSLLDAGLRRHDDSKGLIRDSLMN